MLIFLVFLVFLFSLHYSYDNVNISPTTNWPNIDTNRYPKSLGAIGNFTVHLIDVNEPPTFRDPSKATDPCLFSAIYASNPSLNFGINAEQCSGFFPSKKDSDVATNYLDSVDYTNGKEKGWYEVDEDAPKGHVVVPLAVWDPDGNNVEFILKDITE